MAETKSTLNRSRQSSNSERITLADIFRALRKNWILILIITAFVFLCGVFYTYVIVKPTYKATATVSVEVPTTSEKISVSDAGNSVNASLRYVNSIADFVKSETVMKSVSEKNSDIIDFKKINKETSVSYDTSSIFIYITVVDRNAKNAQTLALSIAEELTRYSVDSKDESVEKFLCTIVVRDKAEFSFYAAPNKALYLAASALGGLLLALGVAFIKEFASNKFQTTDEVASIGVPVLNTLPNDKSKNKDDNSSLMELNIRNFEPYNKLISNIKFANVDNPYRVLMFTSSVMNELKTTVCSNFSLTLAHNDKKVLIIDLDTRKPRVHSVFGVEKNNGIVEYLSGNITKEELIKHTDKNVDIVTAGSSVTNPVTLLESKKLADLINELKEEYDYVVVDTPPLTACNDAAIISRLCDGVVYNVAINQAKKKEVKASILQLIDADANIIGINITKANIKDSGYYYYYSDDKK